MAAMVLFCTKCRRDKALCEFPPDRRNPGRHERSSWCRACFRAKKRATYKPRETRRAANARYYERNRLSIRERQVESRLRSRYGITQAEYEEMLEAQGGVCAICGRPPIREDKRLDVDHNHETGKVRGLLCSPCNTRLHALENLAWRVSAEAYLALATVGCDG